MLLSECVRTAAFIYYYYYNYRDQSLKITILIAVYYCFFFWQNYLKETCLVIWFKLEKSSEQMEICVGPGYKTQSGFSLNNILLCVIFTFISFLTVPHKITPDKSHLIFVLTQQVILKSICWPLSWPYSSTCHASPGLSQPATRLYFYYYYNYNSGGEPLQCADNCQNKLILISHWSAKHKKVLSYFQMIILYGFHFILKPVGNISSI